ncbi:MAG TPA: hypothetical protein VM511_13350 [Luteolibacter sp.]|nr:hypothetical protein [Luteolibacter sp.]
MDDQGAFLAIGGGLVTIVVVATAFSSFMEGRAVKAEVNSVLKEHVMEDSDSLEDLRKRVDTARMKWISVANRKNLDGPCELGKKVAAERAVRIAGLAARKAALNAVVAKNEADFAKYRSAYRISSWETAVGEPVGNLLTLDGREYRQVTLSKVTEDGIEIRHENGVARIPSDQLAETWHRRFQWNWNAAISSSR